MEKKKTNKVVVFLVFILTSAACAGFIWFKLQEVEKNKTNDDKKKSSEKISDKTKDETKKDNNTTNNETVEKIKYENYTSASIQHGTNNNGMEYVKLQIIDGTLKVTVNENEIKVNGFTSKVKSFRSIQYHHCHKFSFFYHYFLFKIFLSNEMRQTENN